MSAYVGIVSCVAIVAIVVPGAMFVLFIVVCYIHLWYWSTMGNGIFIISRVISIETGIIVCCADVIIGFMCRLMSCVGEGQYLEGVATVGLLPLLFLDPLLGECHHW